jgi:hypothetical protein
MRLAFFISLFGISVGVSSCHGATDPNPRAFPDLAGVDVRRWTTGAAAESLDSAGHFRLPVPTSVGPYAITTPESAATLASAFLRAFAYPAVSIGGPLGEHLQRERGAPIDFSRLRPHPRVYFAISPYQPVAENVAVFVRKSYGPVFVVQMVQDNAIVISTISSAYNTDLWVEPDGRIGMPPVGGGAFRSSGIPVALIHGLPLSPEMAVQMAAMATGRRVREIPELVLPAHRYSGQYAHWRLVLDSTVTVMVTAGGATEPRVVSEVYVGLRWGKGPIENWLGVAASQQPTLDTLVYPTAPTRPDAPMMDTAVVAVLRPIQLQRVIVPR